MAPEYGATMGFFPVDEKTLAYLRMTGREESHIQVIEAYLKAQKLFGIPKEGEIEYTKVVKLDLASLSPSVAGPKRTQARIVLQDLKQKFEELLTSPVKAGGYELSSSDIKKAVPLRSGAEAAPDSGGTMSPNGVKSGWSEEEMLANRPLTTPVDDPGYAEKEAYRGLLKHGSIVIAAITSCTNTSNPFVMIGAGLLAKKAVEKGLKMNPLIKTSLAPGSRVVTEYLNKTGLQPHLDALGFQLVAYGCTTCIGNSGPLDANIETAIKDHNLVVASVLSGNRNFEARIHSSVKANFLMSPPLVIAYALAGRVDIDLTKEPLGKDQKGHPVFLKDIWPSSHEIHETILKGIQPEMFKTRYKHIRKDNPVWDKISVTKGAQYAWDPKSTYIRNPPYFDNFALELPALPKLSHLHALALFGDSVTTDHISPAGSFKANSPAGKYLLSQGIQEEDFNSYGSRRGNHEVMMRGTFGNVRIFNKMAGKEGGFTRMPDGEILPIFEACEKYKKQNMPLILFAGKDYGMGSSRDWAAKGTALLGVRAVVAQSFERIHRSNLIGMGVLPLQFEDGESWETHGITGDEIFSLTGLETLKPRQTAYLEMGKKKIKLTSCLDTPTEVDYYKHGGILPYVLRHILA